jgi:dUTP pyrophosphatase
MIKIEFINGATLKDNCPYRGSEEAAGWDLRANENFSLAPGEWKGVGTGIKMAMQKGYKGIIKPRSGLAFKYAIDVLAGVIDSDYRGEVKVILINHGKEYQHFKRYDRIAQIMFEQVPKVTLMPVRNLENDTDRGTGGFGSTGI